MVLPFRKGGAQRIDPTSIEVAYRHEQGFFGFRDHSAQTWSFDAQALPVGAGDNVAPVAVARGEALTVRLHGERNPYDALDEHSEGARRVGEAIFDVSSGELLPDFERLIEGLGDRVLVVTELEVETEWRGHGLGPLIGGLAIDALSGGAVAVLCWPAPLHRQLGVSGDGTERDLTDNERDVAVVKLARMWGRLGLEPFRDGVHYVDTACLGFRQSLDQVLAETDVPDLLPPGGPRVRLRAVRRHGAALVLVHQRPDSVESELTGCRSTCGKLPCAGLST